MKSACVVASVITALAASACPATAQDHASPPIMMAQGSAGGVIGKQGKSVSGSEQPTQVVPAAPAAKAADKPSSGKKNSGAKSAAGCGKVAGVWTWTDAFNSVETYRADGTIVSTSNPQTGRWTCKGNQVVIHWPDGKVERQTASSDFSKLHYVNALGVASVGTKK